MVALQIAVEGDHHLGIQGLPVRAAAQGPVDHRGGLRPGDALGGPEGPVLIALDPPGRRRLGYGGIPGDDGRQIGKLALGLRQLREQPGEHDDELGPCQLGVGTNESVFIRVDDAPGCQQGDSVVIPGAFRHVRQRRPVRRALLQKIIQDLGLLRPGDVAPGTEGPVLIAVQIGLVPAAHAQAQPFPFPGGCGSSFPFQAFLLPKLRLRRFRRLRLGGLRTQGKIPVCGAVPGQEQEGCAAKDEHQGFQEFTPHIRPSPLRSPDRYTR